MKNNIIIIRATTNHLDDLVRMRLLLQNHMEKVNSRIYKYTQNWRNSLRENLIARLNDEDIKIFIACDTDNDQIVGMITSRQFLKSDFEIEKYVKLDDVWVDHNYRKNGICKKLLKKTIEYHKKNNIKHFTLNYVKNNKEAQIVWEKIGFEPVIFTCNININDLKL